MRPTAGSERIRITIRITITRRSPQPLNREPPQPFPHFSPCVPLPGAVKYHRRKKVGMAFAGAGAVPLSLKNAWLTRRRATGAKAESRRLKAELSVQFSIPPSSFTLHPSIPVRGRVREAAGSQARPRFRVCWTFFRCDSLWHPGSKGRRKGWRRSGSGRSGQAGRDRDLAGGAGAARGVPSR
jgi:hypothetical protein